MAASGGVCGDLQAGCPHRHEPYIGRVTIPDHFTPDSSMPSRPFTFPGVLNSKELLVAEAVHARAWATLGHDDRLDPELEGDAKARLGRIVLRLIGERPASVTDLATAAVEEFKATRPPGPDGATKPGG